MPASYPARLALPLLAFLAVVGVVAAGALHPEPPALEPGTAGAVLEPAPDAAPPAADPPGAQPPPEAPPAAPGTDGCGGVPGKPNPRAGCLLPLERGINVDVWLRYGLPNEDVQPWDFERMAALGFTAVRLPVAPEPYERDGHLDQDAVARLDAKLDQVLAAGLAAVVDLHPGDAYANPVLRGGQAQDEYVTFLEELARHLSTRDPAQVALGLLNEPHDPDPQDGVAYDYDPAQRRFWQAARAGAPNTTLIATGTQWSGVEGLRDLDVLPDPNVIYDVHVYEPFLFTHQGATWTWDVVRDLRGVPYPATPESVAPLLPGLTPHVEPHVSWYGKERWGRDKLAAVFDRIAAWRDENGVRVWIGEFGAYAPHAPAADRARWVTDAVDLAEERGMPWAMWEWDRNFGLYDRHTGRVDPALVTALGLQHETQA